MFQSTPPRGGRPDPDMDLPRHLRGLGEFYAPARKIGRDWMIDEARILPGNPPGNPNWQKKEEEYGPCSGSKF